MQRFANVYLLLICFIGFGVASASLLQAQDACCPDTEEVQSLVVYSQGFDCCNMQARLGAAVATVKAGIDKVFDVCPDCLYHALVRICVDYVQNDDGTCSAKVTVYYICCCCIALNRDVPSCSYDEDLCESSGASSEVGTRSYDCCDADSRWLAVRNSMRDAVQQANDYCAMLDCEPQVVGARGFQIDFTAESCDTDLCEVSATYFYSCCCVCTY